MKTIDMQITYVAAVAHPRGPIHLSSNGNFTLCQRRIAPSWQVHDERVTFAVVFLSGVEACRSCARAAGWDERP